MNRPWRLVLVVVLATGWLLGSAPSASAHAALVSTTPSNGEHLTKAPAEVLFRFSERVTPVRGGYGLLNSQGRSVGQVDARTVAGQDGELRLPLPKIGDGAYVVTWRVVSADSHPVHGALVFSVGNARAAPVVDASAQSGADPVVTAAFWFLRWTSYASIALLVGGAFFVALCWPTGRSDGRTRLLRRIGWWSAMGSAVGTLLVQGPNAAGTPLVTVVDSTLLVETLGTTFGVLVVVRIILLCASRYLLDRAGWPVVLGTGLLLAVTWSGTGHDGVGDLWILALAADSVHLLSMSIWLGGLAVLAGCVLIGQRPAAEVAVAVDRFSRVALAAVVALACSGVAMALRETGLSVALAGSDYVKLLLFKLGTFVVLLCVAASSRSVVRGRRLMPAGRPKRRDGDLRRQAVSQLRWSVGGETALAVVVLGLTSVLVATSPTTSTPAPSPVAAEQSGPYLGSVPLTGGGDVQVWVDPAVAGDNRVAINVRDDRGVNRDVPEVTATLSLPSGGVDAVPVPVVRTSAGQFVAQQATIPTAGLWQLDISVRTTNFDESSVRAEVPVH